eukprot:4309706-Prymnesium_polylepis.2
MSIESYLRRRTAVCAAVQCGAQCGARRCARRLWSRGGARAPVCIDQLGRRHALRVGRRAPVTRVPVHGATKEGALALEGPRVA